LTHENGSKLHALLEAFRIAGYDVDYKIFNASAFGIPQNRERIVVIGNREGRPIQWPRPIHHADYRSMAGKHAQLIRAEPLFDGLLPAPITVMEAIGDLPPVRSGEGGSDYGTATPSTDYQLMMREGGHELTWHRATKHSDKMLEIIRHSGRSIQSLPE